MKKKPTRTKKNPRTTTARIAAPAAAPAPRTGRRQLHVGCREHASVGEHASGVGRCVRRWCRRSCNGLRKRPSRRGVVHMKLEDPSRDGAARKSTGKSAKIRRRLDFRGSAVDVLYWRLRRLRPSQRGWRRAPGAGVVRRGEAAEKPAIANPHGHGIVYVLGSYTE
jgi:hypothetical protein